MPHGTRNAGAAVSCAAGPRHRSCAVLHALIDCRTITIRWSGLQAATSTTEY